MIPQEWSLAVGDFAHNARSSLDILLQSITTLPGNDSARRHLQYPICDRATGKRSYESALGRGNLDGIRDPHLAIIESVQPFQQGADAGSDPLALLRNINNSDKHRVLMLIVVATQREHFALLSEPIPIPGGGIRLGIGATAIKTEHFVIEPIGSGVITDEDTRIAKIEFRSAMKEELVMQIHGEFTFGDGQIGDEDASLTGRPVLTTLSAVLGRVKEVIQMFR
jgi:hypothetical protein